MRALLLALLSLHCLSSVAETRFVSDNLQIQMRSGPTTEYRIIKSLNSGTAVQILDPKEENGYLKVDIDGKEGWVPSQFLMTEPSARTQLAKVKQELNQMKANASPAQSRMLELEEQNQALQTALTAAEQDAEQAKIELQRITSISGQAVELDKQNSRLRLENSNLSNEADVLRIENTRLNEQRDRDYIIYGALAVLLGVVIALVVPHLTPKKRHSEWF